MPGPRRTRASGGRRGGTKGGEGGEGAEGDVVPVPHVEFGHGTPRYQWKSHRSTYIALILRHTTVPRKCDIIAGADFINQSLPHNWIGYLPLADQGRLGD